MTPAPTIYLVDDDPVVLKSLQWLIGSSYPRIVTFTSGVEFLKAYDDIAHGCVILDMRMPELSGLDVQIHLAARGATIPVIIMTGHADIPVCTKSFRAGVFDFAIKPANAEYLLKRIGQAIDEDLDRYRFRVDRASYLARVAELTPREKEVLERLIEGCSLKKISGELKISLQTAAKHRTSVLTKLQLENDVELVHAALQYAATSSKPAPQFAAP